MEASDRYTNVIVQNRREGSRKGIARVTSRTDKSNHGDSSIDDGRVKVQFHANSSTLADWFKRCQGVSSQVADGCPLDAKLQSQRPSHAAQDDGKTKARPIPRLHVAIHVVGSRGDVQPFIPIAQLLMKHPYNFRVRICTHPAFKDFVEGNGVEFFSIGGDPEALMAYMVKNPGLLPNRASVKAGDIKKRRREMLEIMQAAWRSCIEAGDGMGTPVKAVSVPKTEDLFIADLIIANPPSMAHLHCAEKLGIPLHMVFTMPWSPTRSFHHPLASMVYGNADPSVANYLSFIMMELLTWQGLGDVINKFRRQTLHLDPISPMWGHQLLPKLRVPYSYLWSESLIPKPADWGAHLEITGFSFLPLAHSYKPPEDLTAFLQSGEPPIYIGFGSIVVDDMAALTDVILEAIRLSGVRAVVSKGWGGIGGTTAVPENVHLLDNCPHDWLFQHVSIVVHHGGAGTTAAGIAAGRPTVIVPFFGDQPFWGQMVARAGAGPGPIPYKALTPEALADGIAFALREETRTAAKAMAQQIATENGAYDTTVDIYRRLEMDRMRCDICPERLAIWKHKKTNAHLSGFAAACLVDRGIIQPNDIKLLQRHEWYLDDGAEHPTVGVAAAISGFFANIATATSDFSANLKSQPKNNTPAPFSPPANTIPNGGEITHGPLTERLQVSQSRDGPLSRASLSDRISPTQMDLLAQNMANKSLHKVDSVNPYAVKPPTIYDQHKTAWNAREQGPHGRCYRLIHATTRYATDVTKAGLKTPVALFYNIANGFHNFPSYGFAGQEVRRRDKITGLGSGLKVAGKEFVLGMTDAITGIAVKPYRGAKSQGLKGFGKGYLAGSIGLLDNSMAAIFGLAGYSLKGLEKELSKRHLTTLKAEILSIRLRQAIADVRSSTKTQRDDVVKEWRRMY